MRYRIRVFKKQFPLVKWFTIHLLYYWELKAQEKNLRHGPFWTFTIDSHLSMACIYWCMVFGATGSNPTHWKHLVLEQDQPKLRKAFTKAVLEGTSFSENEWKLYWTKIVDFRNRYVVHREVFRDKVPHFDKALKVAYAYDRWARTCFPGIWEEPRFEAQEASTRANIRSYITHLTKHEGDWI